MLGAIKTSLIDAIDVSDEMIDEKNNKADFRKKQVDEFLEKNSYIMNSDVRKLCGVSSATANRILVGLTNEGLLIKIRKGGHWSYVANTEKSVSS